MIAVMLAAFTATAAVNNDYYKEEPLVTKTINGSQHLFIQAGGFNEENKPDWKSQWIIMQGE